jgi:hypothetical protein
VVKDGNCESSVYLSMGTIFRIFFHGQKIGNGRLRYSNRSANVWRFGICRSSESGGGTTHVCMGALRAGSWTRAKTLMEILTLFFGESLWKLWKLEKVDGGFTLSIHGNKSAKISRICVHVYVYIQFFFQPLRLLSRGEPCIAAWILLHTGGAIRFGWKCIYICIYTYTVI